jgi:hypothetical protein
MKVVCLVKPEAPLIYFVNALHKRFGVHLAILESPSSLQRLRKKVAARGWMSLAQNVREKFRDLLEKERRLADYRANFDEDWKDFAPGIPLLPSDSVNSEEVVSRLRAEKPDALLCHGTSLVKQAVLETAPVALNLHWGLSPLYRGTHCTDWALINWDPLNIGVTIHRLSRVIDGGGVAAQARARITAKDTCHSINMQLTRLGTDLCARLVEDLRAGKEIRYHDQDYRAGILTVNRQWNKHAARQVRLIERKGILGEMLLKPSRPECPAPCAPVPAAARHA